jgi:hypothetical protein
MSAPPSTAIRASAQERTLASIKVMFGVRNSL